MTHTQLIPDIGIVQCQVSNYEIGDQQFLEHIRADVTGTSLLVRPEDILARPFECGLDEIIVNAIEIDLDALAVFLHTERHRNKGVWFHTLPFVSSDPFLRMRARDDPSWWNNPQQIGRS